MNPTVPLAKSSMAGTPVRSRSLGSCCKNLDLLRSIGNVVMDEICVKAVLERADDLELGLVSYVKGLLVGQPYVRPPLLLHASSNGVGGRRVLTKVTL